MQLSRSMRSRRRRPGRAPGRRTPVVLASQLMAAELYQEGHPPHDWTTGAGLVNGKETP